MNPHRLQSRVLAVTLALLVIGCAAPAAVSLPAATPAPASTLPPPAPAATEAPPTATPIMATATPQPAAPTVVSALPTATPSPHRATPRPTPVRTRYATLMLDDFPLSQLGPYDTGKRTVAFEDAGRGNRPVSITVWYPALLGDDQRDIPFAIGTDSEPDRSGAPYPVILSSTKIADILAPYLISHGFAWASVDNIDTYLMMCEEMIDQPLDILFALEMVASQPLEGLEGMIDAEHAGATGYSFDGYNAYALSGARIDPQHYLPQCPTPDPTVEAIKLAGMSAFDCGPSRRWAEFMAHAGVAITASDDGLWQPMTDERIRAVMPLAGEGYWLFGKRGLAAVDRPALVLVGTEDGLYLDNSIIFEHLGTPDKALISFVGQSHGMIFDQQMVARLAHFMVAFFGYHLQGRQEMAQYFSEELVAQHDDLAWGVYPSE